jgi:glycerol-3-phosphate acyltransferase PlsY
MEFMDFTVAAAALVFGYLAGSVPFGLVLTRMAGLGDVRTIGSGNIGATNVLRTGHKGLAAATLLLDGLKGTFAVLAASWFAGPEAGIYGGLTVGLIAGLGAFLGHCYPVWLSFKGGKGVATFLGILVAVSWQAAIAFAAIWLAIAYFTRYSSFAALVATAATPLIVWLAGMPYAGLLFAVLTAISWYKHRQNISRLLSGEESRIGAKG